MIKKQFPLVFNGEIQNFPPVRKLYNFKNVYFRNYWIDLHKLRSNIEISVQTIRIERNFDRIDDELYVY